MPCGWYPGKGDVIYVEKEKNPLEEASKLITYLYNILPDNIEISNKVDINGLDAVGKLCGIIQNIGEKQFMYLMLKNIETDPNASLCINWWVRHKDYDLKRGD